MKNTVWVALIVAGCAADNMQNMNAVGGSGGGSDIDASSGGSGGGGGSSGSGGSIGTNQLDIQVSGSRLKAKVINTVDGAKVFVSWRDTQLSVDCWFGLAADGHTRCLPKPDGRMHLYSDSTCTQAVIQNCTPGLMPRFAIAHTSTNDLCGTITATRTIYYAAQSIWPTNSNTPIYSLNGSGQCMQNGTGSSNITYYAATEIPASTFVEGVEAVE